MEANRHVGRPMQSWGAEPSQTRLAVLAVHGRGQTPSFMHQQSQRIHSEGIRYYAPHAFGDSWYPRPFMDPIEHNEPDLAHALDALQHSIAGIEADGIPYRDVVLWGFSQGACLLAQLMVSWPSPPAGLLIFTGGFLGHGPIEPPAGRPLDGVPAVLRSIEHDPWVPPGRVQDTAELLAAMGAEVDLRISPGTEHVITDEAMTAAGCLLTRAPERAAQRREPVRHPGTSLHHPTVDSQR
ncbi:alpha/beta hydrolase [Specibacter sp. RAF43]|uniref:alpha/beta hydrolase n=1 Tax=Specibacter sp. RAF43 TaxID=3233057 RepID=UPI003F94F34C